MRDFPCNLSSDTLEYLLYSVSEKKYNYVNADFFFIVDNLKNINYHILGHFYSMHAFFFHFCIL